MSDWQVPGASGSRDDGRTGGPGHVPAPHRSGGWPGPQQPSGAWSGPQQQPTGGPGGRPPGPRPVIPLRPLGLGDVLAGAFTVFRRNARVLLLWSLLLSGILGLAATLVSTLGQRVVQQRVLAGLDGTGSADVFAGSVTAWLALTVGLPVVAGLARGFLVAPVAVDTGQRVLGRRATFGGLWALLAGRRRSVVAWILVQAGAGVLLGAAAVLVLVASLGVLSDGGAGIGAFVLAFLLLGAVFLVVVVWLGTRFAFTIATIALEGRPVFSAAAQSWRLTRGAFWRTFGIILLVQAVFGVAASIASTPLGIGAALLGGTFDPLGQTGAPSGVGAGAVVALVLGSLLVIAVQCIVDVLSASVVTFLAIDRRIRTEGLDQRIAAHLETGQPSDPFAPAEPLPPEQRRPWPPRQWQQPWPPQQPQQWQQPPTWGGPPDGRP